MAQYTFSIHYDGDAMIDHRIPVRELAPSLLALSAAFHEVQCIVNPNESDLSVDISASEPGSFRVDLVLANGPDILQQALSFLTSQNTEAVANLVMYTGIFMGAIKLIKQLAHKKIKSKEITKPGEVRLTLKDGTAMVISEKVLATYQSVEFRKQVKDTMAPLAKPGIDSIDFCHDESDVITVHKEDYEKFEVPPVKDTKLDVTTNEQYLQLVSVAFENGKWKFSAGSDQFFAKIEDKDFLQAVEHNQEQFGSTDTLKVRMRTTQYTDKNGILKSDHEILKVLEHKKGSQQIELDFEDK